MTISDVLFLVLFVLGIITITTGAVWVIMSIIKKRHVRLPLILIIVGIVFIIIGYIIFRNAFMTEYNF